MTKSITLVLSLFLIVLILFSGFVSHEKNNDRPNILMIVMDDAGLDMSAYGRTWVNTPGFDRVAREGILFEKAYTPNAKCGPSRSSIITGRYPWQLDAAANHWMYFPTKFRTYPEVLVDHGYKVGLTGKGWGPGKALTADGEPRAIMGENFNIHTLTPPTKHISKNNYTENFKEFLKNREDNQPWCFWVGFTEPHRAYEFGTGEKLSNKKKSEIESVPGYWPDVDSIRTDMLDYAYEIEYADSHVVQILEHLDELGELDNTIIIYTSDHGMPFPRVKGNQYEDANHVPFAVRWGNGINGKLRKVKDYVSFVDIVPTILEAARIDHRESKMQPIAGKSLIPIFQTSESGQIDPTRDFMLVGQERHDVGRPGDVGYPVRGIHKNGYLFIKNYETDRWPVCDPITGYLNTDGSPTKTYILNQRRNGKTNHFWRLNFGKRISLELYNLKEDPHCVNNLSSKPTYQSTLRTLGQEMESKLKNQGDLRMSGYGYIYEQYPIADLKNINFYERYMAGEEMNANWVNEGDFEKEDLENLY